jgi:gas vesicle protein
MVQNANLHNGYQSSSYEQDLSQNEHNSKLLKGIVIGGLIGGALALIDYNTRTKVKHTASGLKDTSSRMLTEVKENPTEVKDQMISQFKSASSTLKEAINDAQELYQRINKDVFGNINVLREISNDAFSTAKETRNELSSITSKLREAGSELTENPVESNSSAESNNLSNYDTGYPAKNRENTVSIGSAQSNRTNL